jgi:MurNAc alpha-1-phosphate uridylyltransferase
MRDTPKSLMLFAAGFGTRMGALTADRPKPMVDVAGKPLIDHALEQVRGHGVECVVANLHYKPEPLIAHLAGSGVQLSHETPDILDTGGGLRHALPLLGAGPVFTMNTDAVWQGPNPLSHLAKAWEPSKMDALLLCLPRENAVGHKGAGDFMIAPDGRVTRGPGHVYSGLQILKTDLLQKIEARVFSLNVLWDQMAMAGRLYATPYPGKWCDVGHPGGITLAEDLLEYPHV